MARSAILGATLSAFGLAACASADDPAAAADGLAIACQGAFLQGGLAVCRTAPGAAIHVAGEAAGTADANGWFHVGFDRDSASEIGVVATLAEASASTVLAVADRDFDVQRIDGLPPDKVEPRTPEQQRAVEESWVKKRAAFETAAAGDGYAHGFIAAVDGITSGAWGRQRILNGEPKSPHGGWDIAADAGTPIVAPAAGVVTLADPDLYFEGGSIFLDHGNGLVSVMIHMSKIDVEAGQRVERGEKIGEVGSTGRTTGPHLHWGLKWRDKFYLDPELAVQFLPAEGIAASAAARGSDDL